MHLWFEDRKVMRLTGIKAGSGHKKNKGKADQAADNKLLIRQSSVTEYLTPLDYL